MTRRLKVGVSAALYPGASPHTRTFLRALGAAMNLYPEVRDLSFSYADDAADPEKARRVARELVAERVDAVIGPFASECLIAAADVYAEAGIAMVTPGATALLDEEVDALFRICPSDRQIAAALAQRVRARGLRRAAIYSDDSTHSRRLRNLIETALAGRLARPGGQPDTLVYTGRLAPSREWLKATRSAGVRLPVFLTDDAAGPEVLEGLTDPGDLEIVGFPAATQIPEAQGLVHLHRRHFAGELPIYFAESVTAAAVIGQAARRGPSLASALAAGNIESPLGPVTFVHGERQDLRCAIWAVDRAGRLRPDDELSSTISDVGALETSDVLA